MRRKPEHPCPTCGGYARIPIEGGNKSACARCGTVQTPLPFPRHSGGLIANPTPIRYGMKAMIGGKEFWAVGLIRYTEPEDEGGVSVWYEWVLLNPEGDVRYLEFDEGRWTLTEPFTPQNDGALVGAFGASAGASFSINGAQAMVRESGICTVDAFQGEIPWPITAGEQMSYVDLESAQGTFYSGEMASATGEMEWFRGRRLDDREVLTYFGMQHLVTELDRRQSRKSQQGSFGCITLLLAIFAFIMCGVSGCRGKTVAQGSTTAAVVGEEGKRFGPYKLEKVGRVYRLRVSSQMTGTSMWVQGVLENSDAGAFFDVSEEFWDESGYDSDGSWHEWVLEASNDFRLDQPREVFVRLYADPDAAAANAPISYAIEEEVLHWKPFLVFGIIGSILGVIFLIIAGSGGKVWDSMG